MGCLYSRARTTVRHTRSFATTDVNGIARVPRHVLTGVNGTHSSRNGADGKTGSRNGNTRVLIKPPPPPPSPPHSPDSSPIFDVPGLHVQYAEDLEPVEQEMPDEVRARMLPQNNHISHHSKCASGHARSATGSHGRSHGLRETHEIIQSDMALEELDAEMDINIRLVVPRTVRPKSDLPIRNRTFVVSSFVSLPRPMSERTPVLPRPDL